MCRVAGVLRAYREDRHVDACGLKGPVYAVVRAVAENGEDVVCRHGFPACLDDGSGEEAPVLLHAVFYEAFDGKGEDAYLRLRLREELGEAAILVVHGPDEEDPGKGAFAVRVIPAHKFTEVAQGHRASPSGPKRAL